MKIAVVGLWHLGSVYAGCMAHLGFKVTAIDDQKDLIENFKKGKLPVEEPGLADIMKAPMEKGDLVFSSDVSKVAGNEVVWITYDTPVDDNDNADTELVSRKIESLFNHLDNNAVVLISSQLPVGSTRKMQDLFRKKVPGKTVHFCSSPENLRLGAAIDVFLKPDRIIVGTDHADAKRVLSAMLEKITTNIVWMNVASAEMTKHAINAFLANSIVFINEISLICERVGADASEVEKGLKSEQRIGPKAYLKPGNAFAGGTLARDVAYIIKEQDRFGLQSNFFNSIFSANKQHRDWIQLAVSQFFPNVAGKTIAVLGLTYKPGTNTLRRSQAVEVCKWAKSNGAVVQAYDPSFSSTPNELKDIVNVTTSVKDTVKGASVIIVATSWPEFKSVDFNEIVKDKVVVIDPNGFLEDKFRDSDNYRYIKIGRRK